MGGVLAAKGWLDAEFKPDGIKIEENYFTLAGPAINEALANNSVDIAEYGDLPAIIGKAAGLKTIVLAGQRGLQTYVGVPSKSTVKSIEELKGKRVGVAKGTYMHLSFDRKIAQLGLTEKDFDLVNIKTGDGKTRWPPPALTPMWRVPGCCACATLAWRRSSMTTNTIRRIGKARACWWCRNRFTKNIPTSPSGS